MESKKARLTQVFPTTVQSGKKSFESELTQYESVFISEQKKQLYLNIYQLHEAGFTRRKIGTMLKCSRNTVSKYLNGDMQSVCSTELTSGVDRFRDYIVKSLSEGCCRSNIYRELVSKGLQCGKTAAYDFMNRLAEIYNIELSYMTDTTPEQKEKQKQIKEYDYISRRDVFNFLLIGTEMSQNHLSYLFKTYPKFGTLYICIKEFRLIFYKGYQSLLYSFIDK